MKVYELFEGNNMLYHATYRPLLNTIKQEGLGGQSSKPIWPDSKKGVTYLALDPEVAISYAESSDDVPEEWLDEIVLLKIDKTKLDPRNLLSDKNVIDGDSTLEYHGVIPPSLISL